MNDRSRRDELDELLMGLLDGGLTPEGHRRLAALVAEDPEARDAYAESVILDCLLSWERAAAFGAPSPAIEGDEDCGCDVPAPRFRRATAIRWAAAACVVLAGLGLWAARRWQAQRVAAGEATAAAAAAEPSLSGGVAVLTQAVGVAWEPGRAAFGIGSILPAGPLEFRSGIVQVEFYSGATLIVEGPASIDLKANDRVLCRRGRLRAMVPPQARGFRVDSPGGDVVDLGTEFVMSVGVERGAGVEFRVVDGKVEYHGGGGAASRRELAEGEGLHIGAAGELTRASSDPAAFPSLQDLERLGAADSRRRLDRWRDDSARWRGDPRVVAHFPFEPGPQARAAKARTLAADGPGAAQAGAIVGCDWVEGRWPGKAALEFKRPGDRVRVDIPGAFDALTFLAWVRVDARPQRLCALMLTDGFDSCEPHWQIDSGGRLVLGVHREASDHWKNYVSPEVFAPGRLGRWTHLATVYDGPEGTVAHFVDGDEVGREPIEERVRLALGKAELGNWGAPVDGDLTPVRNLTGRMDEFLLLGAALAPREVREIYERGRP